MAQKIASSDMLNTELQCTILVGCDIPKRYLEKPDKFWPGGICTSLSSRCNTGVEPYSICEHIRPQHGGDVETLKLLVEP